MNKLLYIVLLLIVLLAACSSGTPAAQPTTAPSVPVAPVATTTPAPKANVPDNIPILDGATDLQVTQSDISYVVKGALKDVMDTFDKQMLAKGWKEQEKPAVISDFGRMYYADPTHQVSILLNASPTLNQVVVRMSLITLNVVESTPTPKP